MEETKNNETGKINVSFTTDELYQLHLCVACRAADNTIKWANASTKEEKEYAETTAKYLNHLIAKIGAVIDEAKQ